MLIRDSIPSFSILIKNNADARRTVDATNIAFMLASIVSGKVGAPQFVKGISTANIEKSHTLTTTEKKMIGTIFLKPISSFPIAIKSKNDRILDSDYTISLY